MVTKCHAYECYIDYFKNHWTKHKLVCIHSDVFSILIPNLGISVKNSEVFENFMTICRPAVGICDKALNIDNMHNWKSLDAPSFLNLNSCTATLIELQAFLLIFHTPLCKNKMLTACNWSVDFKPICIFCLPIFKI